MNHQFGLAACALAWVAISSGTMAAPGDPPVQSTADAPTAPRPVNFPEWAERPNGYDIARVYPRDAERTRMGGTAELGCKVLASGRLGECQVLAEQPAGWDFGAAALKLSPRFRMKPTTRDGAPTAGGSVRIPIRFQIMTQP